VSAAATAPRLRTSLPQLYAAAAVRLLLPMVVLPIVATRVGAAEFGRLGFILIWAGLLAALVEGGFLAAATRLAVVADADGRRRLAQQVFSARAALSLPAVLFAFMAVRWGAPDDAHRLVDSLSVAALACALGWPATWYLQATQQLHRWARVEFVVYAVLVVACIAFARSVPAFVALQLSASALLALLGWRRVHDDLAAGASPLSLYANAALRPGLRLGFRMLPVSLAGVAYSMALPAAASAQLSRPELGIYFMADRLVRAVLAAAEPVYSLVYPRMVALFAHGQRAALRYAARWATVGGLAGVVLLAAAQWLWQRIEPVLLARSGGIDLQAVHAVAFVLAWLWPLLLAWKFIGYWMLGSGGHDTAYRTSMIVGGVVGVTAAATIGGRAGAMGLAWTALGVELLVIVVAVAMMGARRRSARAG